MKTRLIFFGFWMLYFHFAFGQLVTYEDYIYPDVDFTAWSVGASNLNAANFLASNASGGFNLGLTSNYNQSVNRRGLISNRNGYFNGYFNLNKAIRAGNGDSEHLSLYNSFGGSLQNRVYPNKDRGFFYDYGFGLFSTQGYSHNRVLGRILVENSFVRSNVRIPFGVGKGRIEPMGEVFQAHFLMDDLIEGGLWEGEIEQSDVFELARLMAIVRNRRTLDNRRQRVYEWKQLCAWLDAHTKEGADKVAVFAALVDNHTFVPISNRGMGRIYCLKGSVYGARDLIGSQLGNENGNQFFGQIEQQWNKEQVVNQFWQESIRARAGINYSLSGDVKSFGTFVVAGYGKGYFPNSRSAFYLDLDFVGLREISSQNKNFALVGVSGLNYQRFISFSTTLYASFGATTTYKQKREQIFLPSNLGLNNYLYLPISMVEGNNGTSLFGSIGLIHFLR